MRFLTILVAAPLLALVPGLGLLGLFWRTRQRVLALGGTAWLLYALYETGMRLRLLCSGECNIRVDLLLIYPALLAVTVAGLITLLRRPRGGGPPARQP